MENRQHIIISCLLALLCGNQLQADVVDTVLAFDTNTVNSWTPVDFNADGTNEISFFEANLLDYVGIVDPIVLTQNVLNVAGGINSQVLIDNGSGSVLPLDTGATISLTPSLGSWGAATYPPSYTSGPNIWIKPFSSSDVSGVGAPGYGDYMGVRFMIESEWYYGWIRFSPTPGSQSSLPSILEFAYETNPNTAIEITPAPEPNVSLLCGLSAAILFTANKAIRKQLVF